MYIRRHMCMHVYFFSGRECKPLRIDCFYLVKNTSLFTSRVKVKKRCLLGKNFISTWNRLLKNSHLCEMDSLNVNFCNAFVSWMCILRFLLFFFLFLIESRLFHCILPATNDLPLISTELMCSDYFSHYLEQDCCLHLTVINLRWAVLF